MGWWPFGAFYYVGGLLGWWPFEVVAFLGGGLLGSGLLGWWPFELWPFGVAPVRSYPNMGMIEKKLEVLFGFYDTENLDFGRVKFSKLNVQ